MLELEDIIAVWTQRELIKKKKCDRILYDRRNNGLFSIIF